MRRLRIIALGAMLFAAWSVLGASFNSNCSGGERGEGQGEGHNRE